MRALSPLILCFKINNFHFSTVGFFRGCAPSFFPLDETCRVELEAVLVGSGSQRVAPRVELCFCNSKKCNNLDKIEDYKMILSSSVATNLQLNFSFYILYYTMLFNMIKFI